MPLNPSQQRAVSYEGGHLLIVAGPGTGKTHTLTERISRIASNLPPGEKILAITFTHKAAEEMRGRLASRLANPEDLVFIGTFHQFCLGVLREQVRQAGLPQDFRVADEEEMASCVKELWPEIKARERRVILDEISRFKASVGDTSVPPQVEAYNRALREKGLLDFDDLLSEACALFKKDPQILSRIQAVYPYVFVDEYQDINAIQHELLKMLVSPGGCLTAIGDPNQAIYGFRGSDVTFFESFERDFPGAARLSLSQNYRSAKNILSACGQIMSASQDSSVPELVATIYQEGRLVIYQAPTERAEAEYVVHQVEKLVGGTTMFSHDSGRVESHASSPYSFGDIAVFYRLNSQARLLKEAFARSGIPYHIAGKNPQDNKEQDLDDVCPLRGEEISFDAQKVQLMTLHASKGLEFPVVFVVGCEENLIPLNLEGMRAQEQEERRLFYVGMTRAKECLYLLSAKHRQLYGKTYTNAPCAFLKDIEEKLKEYEKAALKPRRKDKEAEQFKLF